MKCKLNQVDIWSKNVERHKLARICKNARWRWILRTRQHNSLILSQFLKNFTWFYILRYDNDMIMWTNVDQCRPGPRCWWSFCCRWCPIVQSAAIPAVQRKEFRPLSEQASKHLEAIQVSKFPSFLSYFQILRWNFQVEHSSTAWFHPAWSAHERFQVSSLLMLERW